MQEKINQIKADFENEISQIKDLNTLEDLRIKYLSRKGIVSVLFDEFKRLPNEEKRHFGQVVNTMKNDVLESFNSVKSLLEQSGVDSSEIFDMTLPGRKYSVGSQTRSYTDYG